MNLSVFMNPKFWFVLRPMNLSNRSLLFFVLAAVVFFVLGVVILISTRRAAKRDPIGVRGERQLAAWCMMWSALALVWLFFVYERINVFGAPFWLLAAAIGAIVWLGFIVWYMLRTVPRLRARARFVEEKEKYLPRKK